MSTMSWRSTFRKGKRNPPSPPPPNLEIKHTNKEGDIIWRVKKRLFLILSSSRARLAGRMLNKSEAIRKDEKDKRRKDGLAPKEKGTSNIPNRPLVPLPHEGK